MGSGTKTFDRWVPIVKTTWPFQVFNKYNDEFNQLLWSYSGANKTIYRELGNSGIKWEDKASKYILFDVPADEEVFEDLREWSDTYNKFNNWVNLNSLIALCSNLETYLATIISLSIESDPGVLIGASKSVDGIILLKNKTGKNIFHDDLIISCTKGDWSARVSAFKKIFGTCPDILTDQIGELDKVRILRNKVGHAFGRDIDESRNHEVKEIIKIESLSADRLKKIQHLIWNVVKAVDLFLLENHIGNYQSIVFYHRLKEKTVKQLPMHQTVLNLKKALGKLGDTSGKVFCKGLIDYYENIGT